MAGNTINYWGQLFENCFFVAHRSLKTSMISIVLTMVASIAFSQNLSLTGNAEKNVKITNNAPGTSINYAEQIDYEKLEGPLIIAIINGIDLESGIADIEVINKLVTGNKLSHFFGPDIHQELAGIVHTYSEHFTASFQILADSQVISAFDEEALQRLEIINSYYNRKLKVLIHQLIMDTNFGQETSSIEVWKQQANKVLDDLFDLWSDYLSYH
jgi:hypothetical protein